MLPCSPRNIYILHRRERDVSRFVTRLAGNPAVNFTSQHQMSIIQRLEFPAHLTIETRLRHQEALHSRRRDANLKRSTLYILWGYGALSQKLWTAKTVAFWWLVLLTGGVAKSGYPDIIVIWLQIHELMVIASHLHAK